MRKVAATSGYMIILSREEGETLYNGDAMEAQEIRGKMMAVATKMADKSGLPVDIQDDDGIILEMVHPSEPV